MSSNIAIKLENVSKSFHIYDKPNDRLKQMLTIGDRKYYKEFLAVDNISFEIEKGTTVGIVGRNGSGKSTLLQLICGTLNTSFGNIHVNGRIAALLELGSGFNPEFTGRENVYMNAAILGLSKKEINIRFDDIAAFADIGQFIEQPVKIYSSGMMMRLAFAVAINVEPEILIIDEALSVGDELFQRKCFSKIQAIKEKGSTILFVSHSGGAIIELCDRAILIDNGELILDGSPKQVVGKYQKLLYASAEQSNKVREDIKGSEDSNISELNNDISEIEETTSLDLLNVVAINEWFDKAFISESIIKYQSYGANIVNIKILNLDGVQVNHLQRNTKYKYQYQVIFDKNAENIMFGMLIKTKSGLELGGAISEQSNCNRISFIPKGSIIMVEFEFTTTLVSGTYFLNAGVNGLVNGNDTYLHRILDACVFKVLPDESENTITGIVDFSTVCLIKNINN